MARLLLLLALCAVLAEGSHVDTCVLCAHGGDCSGAYLGSPGRYCGAYNTTYGIPELCCCAENDVCGTPHVDGQCECTTIKVDPTRRGPLLLRTTSFGSFVVDAILFLSAYVGAGLGFFTLQFGLVYIAVVCTHLTRTSLWCRRHKTFEAPATTDKNNDAPATETNDHGRCDV